MGGQLSVSRSSNETDQSQKVVAGGNVTYATYNIYGDTYASASTMARFEQDPTPFTNSAVDMTKVALASPTVEECGYSDRLLQLTLGNSTITTQEAAHVICAYKSWPKYLEDNDATAIDMPTKPDTAVCRFYTLDSVDWTTTSRGWFWRFPGCLKNTGLFGQNMAYHFLQRSGFALHTQCNASKFHQGLLLVVWIPEFEFLSTNITGDSDSGSIDTDAWDTMQEDYYSWRQLTVFPHQLINLRTNNSSTIIVPYINCVPMDNGLTHNNGALLILPIVPLAYSTGASTTVALTISVAPMCAEYNGLRFAMTQGLRFRALPGSGQFVTTEAASAPPLLPHFDSTNEIDIPGEVRNLMEVAKIPTFMNMRMNSRSGFEITTAKTPGEELYDVALQFDNLTSGSVSPLMNCYLGQLSRFFSHWSGSIRISFMFTGAAMTTGKILICYTPPGGGKPGSRREGMLGTHIIWDFGLQSTVDMVIPWVSATQYRICDQPSPDSYLFSAPGRLTIFMQTRMIVPPDTPTTAYIVGFISACDDFAMRLPMDHVTQQGPVQVSKTGVEANGIKAGPLAITAPTESTSGELTTENAPALGAIESGSGENTTPEQVMETRAVNATKSMLETSIENFFSRSALCALLRYEHKLDGTQPASDAYTTWQIDLLSDANWDIKRKMRMFTYVRCDLEVTVLITTSGIQNYENLRYQVMYCPPGARVPDSQVSRRWQTATSPSIFCSTTDPPATFSLPFLSTASAYSMFYDGYSDFEIYTAVYGRFPPNDMGTIAVRAINAPSTTAVQVEVRIYCKPKHVRCWCPRPIPRRAGLDNAGVQTSWLGDNSGVVAGSFLYINKHIAPTSLMQHAKFDSDELDLQIYRVESQHEQNNVDIPQCTCGKGWYYSGLTRHVQHALLTPPVVQHFNAGEFYPEHYQIVHLAEGPGQMGDCGNVLYCRHGPIGLLTGSADGIVAFIPLRIFVGMFKEEYNAALAEIRALNKPEKPSFKDRILSFFSRGQQGCTVGIHQIKPRHLTTPLDKVVEDHPERDITVVLAPQNPPEHKIAGCDCLQGCYYSSATGRYHSIDLCAPSFRLISGPYGEQYVSHVMTGEGVAQPGDSGQPILCQHGIFGLLIAGDTQKHTVSFADIRDLAPRYQIYSQGCAEWIQSLGNSFGEGFCDTVRQAMTSASEEISSMLPDWTAILETIIQVIAALGINYVPKQGDWMKKFLDSVNAFKGIDWLVAKIQKFIDWIKEKIVPECREKADFLKRLPQLPVLHSQLKQFKCSKEADQETLQRMYSNVHYFDTYCKKYAPLYAAEAKMVRECEAILQTIQLFRKPGSRTEPVAVIIRGAPGTGKSLATTLIGNAIAKKINSSVYSLPPDPKYFDGYLGQKVCIMDDVGQNPDGEDLKYFCQMVSTTDFYPPMADLVDKGTLFTSQYVLVSTNTHQFNPPTISEPKALQRRFFLDLQIKVADCYQKEGGRLNGATASKPCDQCKPKNFTACNPIICGKAIKFQHNGAVYSLDDVVTLMMREYANREKVCDMLAAVLQGPPQYFDDCHITVAGPPPECISDLLQSVRNEEVLQYCKRKGWIVEVFPSKEQMLRESQRAICILQSVAALVALLSAIYIAFKLFYTLQGPYSGLPQKKPQVPTLKEVQIQGPNLDFAVSMMQRNMRIFTSSAGEYTALGICDDLLVIPTHAYGDNMMLNGCPIQVLDCWSIKGSEYKTEITVLKIKTNQKFRDITPFLPTEVDEWTDCCVAINTTRFPRMFLPVGNVTPSSNIALSGYPTERVLMYNYPTRSGQCGGVVLKTGKVIGIHIGGNGAQGFCAALLKKYFPKHQGQVNLIETTTKRLHIPSRTMLQPSVFHDVFEGKKEPAVLHPKDSRLKVDFEAGLLSKYKGNVDVDYWKDDEMQLAVKHYASQLQTLCINPDPICVEDAIYGFGNLNALDLATSAGYPYVTQGVKKRDLISKEDRATSVKNVERAIMKYGLELPFVTYLKDELRSPQKIAEGKTRLIEASSLNDSVAMRCAYGNLYEVFHSNPGTLTGSAVGCDPDLFWSKLVCMMKEHLLCFDYTNYDASLSPCWFTALKHLLTLIGFGKHNHFINYMCHSVHLMGDKKYYVSGGMPSGCSGTSIFNSMINNIIIRTLLLKTYDHIDLDELRMVAYGDDVIASYDYPLDAAALARTAKHYGLTLTPADKSDTFQTMTWANVTFLKRYFRADEQFGFLIHPVMPMAEIEESIRWTKDPKNTQDHVRSLCLLAWHNGPERYADFCRKIRTVAVGTKLYLPDYDVLRYNWINSF
ncbi:polyprotein [Picornaviridae sp. rodent/Ee/PicoV/NX2015]|uniref:Genome polyprotein n=1 Tax=Picornaviridae sp. rodent/Ee/PicoV/NX2015 TaxID=1917412 RepID=A0A1I9WAM3_9ENTO|nr:polyprotein [Picornaviridae sp. rodent/Ee/PicoV/NX2015]APA29022.1 polyprotein [Picornaviridae sp. rodent/Ee/PicoV/NX2015]